MKRYVVMDENGAVTLPLDTLEGQGWWPDMILDVTITEQGDIMLTRSPGQKRPVARSQRKFS